MGLRIVYGRAGTGKSHFCFKEISKKIKENEKIYIITPEQFSFTAEKKLMDSIDTSAVINAEVLTFQRMAYRVINEVGGVTKINLTDCGKSMLIFDVLNRNKKKLKFLGKTDENIELINTILTEFKKHNIDIIHFKEELDNIKDQYLKIKMQDILIIYEDIQKKILENYIDENDMLTILSNNIECIKSFDNSLIYIDEFAGFTPQEYEILKKLFKKAKQVTITICTDTLEQNTNPDIDIFYSNKMTANKLMKIVNENDIKIEKNIELSILNRFKNMELVYLEQNLYTSPYKKYENQVDNIKLFLANNQYSEIEYIAENIEKLVREQNYRYKDISVITKNLDTYSNLIKAIFKNYNIPVFIDEKKDLSQNNIVKYMLSILDIFSKNWSYEAVFNYIKSGFLDIEKDEIFKLENYCLKWGIKGNKWYKQDWKFGTIDDKNNQEILRFDELRKIIVIPLLELKESLKKNKTVQEFTKTLYEFLIKNNIDEKIENKILKLEKIELTDIANEYKNSWSIILELLDQIVLLFSNEKITFERYSELLKIGLKNSALRKNTRNTRSSNNWRCR